MCGINCLLLYWILIVFNSGDKVIDEFNPIDWITRLLTTFIYISSIRDGWYEQRVKRRACARGRRKEREKDKGKEEKNSGEQ